MKHRFIPAGLVLMMALSSIWAKGIEIQSDIQLFTMESKMEQWTLLPVAFCQSIVKASQRNSLFDRRKPSTSIIGFLLEETNDPDPDRIALISSYTDEQIDGLIASFFSFGSAISQEKDGTGLPSTLTELVSILEDMTISITLRGKSFITDEELQFLMDLFPNGWDLASGYYENYRHCARALTKFIRNKGSIPKSFQLTKGRNYHAGHQAKKL